ncbi:molybdopterin-dependent oxidoreductase [Variovorax sp. J2P1-59]|uniref:xanthine dehydrogenase family protein molybdopterin-binding subunit n=1 Tax=Variovorax flavidus TaxID=3053501 RepID=UPI002578DE34|nr:molybdopterin cofactor-binding domain-containing protein [Variovorax sp. J2P1-59]MDM0078144.1 molybdopterin-dependent oxidoreductase [Variovorax sp. J2P1-59]
MCAQPHMPLVSRRHFIVQSAGLAIGVVFAGPSGADAVRSTSPFSPTPWVTLEADGTIILLSPGSEMGQGTSTALPMCLAEDLDVEWTKVIVRQAPHDPRSFGNPRFAGAMHTGASRTTRGYYKLLRIAGAQARQVILLAAAEKWGLSASSLETKLGVVIHRASGRSMPYAEAASIAKVPANLPEITEAMLKPLAECRYLGRSLPRLDLLPKVTGRAVFGIDVRLPGMLYGAVLRSPLRSGRPLAIDDVAARETTGYLKTLVLPYGVGVLATSTWAAHRAKDALKVTWSNTDDLPGYDSEQTKASYQIAADNVGHPAVIVDKHGDAPAAIATASRVFEADYISGHLAHMTLEPMNATARVSGNRIEVWAPTQVPSATVNALAKAFRIPPEDIAMHVTMLGGGFGRRLEVDFAVDAVMLATEAEGRPVKVTWTREDDVRNDFPRPLVAQHLQVGLDKQGKVVGWRTRIASESVFARTAPAAYVRAGGKDVPVNEGSESLYEFDSVMIEYLRQEGGIDVGFWRGVGGGYTKFASETMLDEISTYRGVDPLALRLELLRNHPRAQAVLRQVATMAAWERPRVANRALGIAYSDLWDTHTATVAQVSVDPVSGLIQVHALWTVVDAGIVLMPDNALAQIEGGLIWGLEAALKAELSYKNGMPQQSNFHDYSVMRLSDVPELHVRLLRSENPPGGVGECGVPPVAPAIANAVARLTGTRLRSLPMTPDLLRDARARSTPNA